jgi:hypothetical protein
MKQGMSMEVIWQKQWSAEPENLY